MPDDPVDVGGTTTVVKEESSTSGSTSGSESETDDSEDERARKLQVLQEQVHYRFVTFEPMYIAVYLTYKLFFCVNS